MDRSESSAEVEIRPIGPDRVDVLRDLFDASRSTRHCSCMAYCSTSRQFDLGWYGGGNRRRFEALARTGPDSLGVAAIAGGEPVGWCACGPRARYTVALSGRSRLLAQRPRAEDEHVWLIPCLVVRPGESAIGLAVPLIRAAVELARAAGATAVEAWPLANGVRRRADLHLGREGVFARLGFGAVERPAPGRVIMRVEF